jgi:hypothetical protein
MGFIIAQNIETMGVTFRAFLSGQGITFDSQTKLLI